MLLPHILAFYKVTSVLTEATLAQQQQARLKQPRKELSASFRGRDFLKGRLTVGHSGKMLVSLTHRKAFHG